MCLRVPNSGAEYAWTPESFPVAIERAEAHGLACLGGQFQFRLDHATCEMYWLAANPKERTAGESWAEYCHRSCSEVRECFESLMSKTDFSKEALDARITAQHGSALQHWTLHDLRRSFTTHVNELGFAQPHVTGQSSTTSAVRRSRAWPAPTIGPLT